MMDGTTPSAPTQEPSVEQRHRDMAGELFRDLGLPDPEPHDGNASLWLETAAIHFARAQAAAPRPTSLNIENIRSALEEAMAELRDVVLARGHLPFCEAPIDGEADCTCGFDECAAVFNAQRQLTKATPSGVSDTEGEVGRSLRDGLSSLRDGAAIASPPEASIPNAETVRQCIQIVSEFDTFDRDTVISANRAAVVVGIEGKLRELLPEEERY